MKNKGEFKAYRIVKSVENERFEVAMIELANGSYKVLSAPNDEGGTDQTESIPDYNTASYTFDAIVQKFEGN